MNDAFEHKLVLKIVFKLPAQSKFPVSLKQAFLKTT